MPRVGWLWTAPAPTLRFRVWSSSSSPVRASAQSSGQPASPTAASKGRVLQKLPSFEDVQWCIETEQWELLKRAPEMTQKYREVAASILSRYETLGDEILVRLWGFPVVPSEERPGAMRADLAALEVPSERRAVLCPNNFPYALHADVLHWVLWCLDPLEPHQVEAFLRRELADARWVYYENPQYKKTVPTVWHVQVFSAPL